MKKASTATTRTPPSSGLTDLSRERRKARTHAARKRPPRIVLVVACSQRKRSLPPHELRLSSIDAAPEERPVRWRTRLREVDITRHPAHRLYMGDHWRAACEAYNLALRYSSRTELWVVSAGYGLIASTKEIKPYSATFANGSADSVWRGSPEGDRLGRLQDWWEGLPHDAALPDLLRGDDGAVVITAGAPYLTALGADLARVLEDARSDDRVSVISAGTRGIDALLPVSGRFRATVGGTDGALNARVLTMLATQASAHRFGRSAMTAILEATAAKLPAARRDVGRPATDEQIAHQIERLRRRFPGISRTRALRELRGHEIACEQDRFASIWNRIVAAPARQPGDRQTGNTARSASRI
jgi:hypothetical protein